MYVKDFDMWIVVQSLEDSQAVLSLERWAKRVDIPSYGQKVKHHSLSNIECRMSSYVQVLIDDFRKDWCEFHELLELLDKYLLKLNVKALTMN